MYPILFKIGPLSIQAYGFGIAIAFLIGILITMHYARKVGIKPEIIIDLTIYVIIAAIVGSRLLYVIGQWDKYKDNLTRIFMVHEGGLAFLGGFGLSILVIALFARVRKVSLLKLLDAMSPGVAIGYAIARIGCFLNGCCFGIPANIPWAIKFPRGALAYFYYPGIDIHPTQLYALFSMLAVFLIILYLWEKRKYDGYVSFWFLILYSTYRFVVEFFRYCPDDLVWLGLKPGQFISLVMLAAGVAGLGLMHKRFKTGL